MSDNQEIINAIKELHSKMEFNFGGIDAKFDMINARLKTINKRLDGIEGELRKIDTVLSYSEQYDNIPT